MKALTSRKWTAPGAAAPLALATWAGFAAAGEVPATALSRSLAIEPILLDHSSLLFQLPQLAASADTLQDGFGRLAPRSVLLAYAANESGLGTVLRGPWIGGFVLSQPSYLATGMNAPGARFDQRSNILQVGAAVRWRRWRAGAALRGSRDRVEDGSRGLVAQGAILTGDTDAGDFLEGAFGLGARLGRSQFDVCVEIPHETYDLGTANMDPSDTLVVQLRGETRNAVRGVVRFTTPEWHGLRGVAAGAYRSGALSWSGLRYERLRLRLLDFEQGLDGWMAAMALEVPAPHFERVAVSGAYARGRKAIAGTEEYFGIVTVEQFTERGQFAVSGQRHLWHDLVMQAAVGVTYSRSRRDEVQVRRDETRTESDRSEGLRDSFAWGLTYAWRRLEFAATLDATLDPYSLFTYLDIHIGL